jgi:hypothetical protein
MPHTWMAPLPTPRLRQAGLNYENTKSYRHEPQTRYFLTSDYTFAEEDNVDEIKEDPQVKQEKHLLDMDKNHNVAG